MSKGRLGITGSFTTLHAGQVGTEPHPEIRILCVEDSASDFELMGLILRGAGLAHSSRRVEDEPGMREALVGCVWDVVISDHNLPRFSSAQALMVLREFHEDVPFLIVSGAIGEDAAVSAMQAGADDYLMKHSLKRLAPAIERALSAAAARRQRSAATTELRASLDYLRAVLTASPVGIMTLDQSGAVTLFNAAAERIFGVPRAAISADPRLLAAEPNTTVLHRLVADTASGALQNMEEVWRRADGEKRDFVFAAARLEGDGDGAGLVVFVTDLTEQKRAELAQRETETRFAAISSNLPGVVFQMLARPAQRLMLMPFVSAGATSLFGLSPENFLADPASFAQLLDPVDRDAMFVAVEQSTRKGVVLEGQWQVRRADQSQRWIQLSASAREVGGGNWLFDGIITDITAQKHTEQELTRSREELRELTAHIEHVKEEERRAVARDIHDDIGSTLTGMKADLAWLKRRFDDPEVRSRLEGMTALVDGAVQTANRIVQTLRPGILDYGIAAALEWQARDFATHTGIEVGFETNEDDLTLDIEQSTALFRVFQESLTNVAKYARASQVETELFATSTSVTLEVRDNGAGLEPGALGKPSSFGVRGMMERVRSLGGWLDISGPPGRGTTVMLSIPRRRQRHAAGQIQEEQT